MESSTDTGFLGRGALWRSRSSRRSERKRGKKNFFFCAHVYSHGLGGGVEVEASGARDEREEHSGESDASFYCEFVELVSGFGSSVLGNGVCAGGRGVLASSQVWPLLQRSRPLFRSGGLPGARVLALA